jgi:hypothetical protein
MKISLAVIALGGAIAAAALPAVGADDRFHKEKPGSMNGFLAATDPLYVKECGSCHFAFSPGLLPARSWELYVQRFDAHFGEKLGLDAATREKLREYLVANAADRSPYEGSKVFMERVEAKQTPYRLREVRLFREMHFVVTRVMHTDPRVKVKTLVDCGACHQLASEGSFGNSELVVPGLTPTTRKW